MSEGSEKPQVERVRSGVILWRTMRAVGAQPIFIGYLAFLLASCAFFCWAEPETFGSYGEAVWYCFQTITTIGFGDVVAQTMPVRVLSIVVGLSALFVVALLTGITVSFFNEKMRLRRNESFLEFEHSLERLSELSRDELVDLERRYRDFAGKPKR